MERSQTRGRSTQKRIRKDWHVLLLKRGELQTRQRQEWLVHRCEFFQQGILKSPLAVIDFTHSIVMPERGDGINAIAFGLHVLGEYDDRQCRPDIQRLRVDRSLSSAVKFQEISGPGDVVKQTRYIAICGTRVPAFATHRNYARN